MADWVYDEIVLAAELVYRHGWNGVRGNVPLAIELSELLNAAPFHPVVDREPNFRSPNSVQRKTFDIATQHPAYAGKATRGNRLDKVVLGEFIADPNRMTQLAAEIRATILAGDITSIPDDIDWDDVSAPEGRLTWVKHARRERNPAIRRKKIDQVKSLGKPVACEACGFDFKATYGKVGTDYIQVHHVLPLHASGPAKTKLSDLVLLCANCHSMIHRPSPWLTPAELTSFLAGGN